MFQTLLLIGLGCVIAAVVGGGLAFAGVSVPVVSSLPRQILLAVVGVAIIAADLAFVEQEKGGSHGTARLVLSKASGPPGSSLTASGSGFGSGETVLIRFHVEQVGRVEADGDGRFAGQSILVPGEVPVDGQFDITAVGESSGQSAGETFRIPPAALELSKVSGSPGTMLTVRASGFAAGEAVEIVLHQRHLVNRKANGDGELSPRVRIPHDWLFNGQFDVIAEGETSQRVARRQLTVGGVGPPRIPPLPLP